MNDRNNEVQSCWTIFSFVSQFNYCRSEIEDECVLEIKSLFFCSFARCDIEYFVSALIAF